VFQLEVEIQRSKYVDIDLHQRKFKLLPKYRTLVQELTEYLDAMKGSITLAGSVVDNGNAASPKTDHVSASSDDGFGEDEEKEGREEAEASEDSEWSDVEWKK
jgi:hypothetical protein